MTNSNNHNLSGRTQIYSGATQPRSSPPPNVSHSGTTQPRQTGPVRTKTPPKQQKANVPKQEYEWKNRPEPKPPYGMIIGAGVLIMLLFGVLSMLIISGIQAKRESVTERPSIQETLGVTEPREEKLLMIEDANSGEDLCMPELATGSFTGSLESSRQEDQFTYTAPYDGTYGFVLSEMESNANAIIKVYDDTGKLLISSSGVAVADLEGGRSYTLLVIQSVNFTFYRLNVYVPNRAKDISNAASVTDRIVFSDQVNAYTYTAPESGVYEFRLSETMYGFRATLRIYDSGGKMLTSTSCAANATLQAGQSYTITVSQNADRGSYKLLIGVPKPVYDLTGYDGTADSITFDGQINRYLYTAPADGIYSFLAEDTDPGSYMTLSIQDPYLYPVGSFSGNGKVTLEGGVTYSIAVGCSGEAAAYKLHIQTP